MKKLLTCLFSLALAVAASAVFAGDCCQKCGCVDQLQKVCKAVPDVKKVKVTVWDCTCEEICIPGRTLTHDCQPTCGQVRAVRKLVKKEVTKEVPTFKWVMETVCVGCCDGGRGTGHGLLHHSKVKPTPAPAVIATKETDKK